MSFTPKYESAAAWYTAILKNSRKSKLPPNYPQPQPPAAWPEENVALLERYLLWLYADNASLVSIQNFYLPIAGHILGYHLQPHPTLDLEEGFQPVLDYLQAKQVSQRWLDMAHRAHNRFRRFMHQERGLAQLPDTLQDLSPRLKRYQDGLPDWLVHQLCQYQQIRQANWRPSRIKGAIINFWRSHTQLWRWMFANYGDEIESVSDIQRRHIYAFIDDELEAGYGIRTINLDIRAFQATLRFLQEREYEVPQALLRQAGLREPADLPRFLTDEQIARLQAAIERRVTAANTPARQRNALLDRALFYLLWQAGLRGAELKDLELKDLSLANQQLMVRGGKGLKDRTLYLTDRICLALKAYLAQRGTGYTDHLFLYRHEPMKAELVRNRIKAAGKRAGVKVTPHMLRHTFGTQLVNAGCTITTIQALLGHKRLSTTLIYSQIHNQTVAEDYFTAMEKVEQRLAEQLPPPQQDGESSLSNGTTSHLLTLVDGLNQDPLTDSQQALVTELQQGLAALVQGTNGAAKPLLVNEPARYLEQPIPLP
ncbi:MAG: tyrosine-type recombinase/integrase [Ardenticatenaceae bacterium]|nr:tyrosine-type recombinase/integrase [Anaerolineales bacterium]MCB9009667.1 tyrosine-type recombinase/integrase [Ardenticatenaceae bacterium]